VLFKTLKYRPAYPLEAFDTLFAARNWVAEMVRWYNHEHRHSAIRFVTPAQRHANLDRDILDSPHDALRGCASVIRCAGEMPRATGSAFMSGI
jgi:hypothetical protein